MHSHCWRSAHNAFTLRWRRFLFLLHLCPFADPRPNHLVRATCLASATCCTDPGVCARLFPAVSCMPADPSGETHISALPVPRCWCVCADFVLANLYLKWAHCPLAPPVIVRMCQTFGMVVGASGAGAHACAAQPRSQTTASYSAVACQLHQWCMGCWALHVRFWASLTCVDKVGDNKLVSGDGFVALPGGGTCLLPQAMSGVASAEFGSAFN
jgi:hypothetical protein